MPLDNRTWHVTWTKRNDEGKLSVSAAKVEAPTAQEAMRTLTDLSTRNARVVMIQVIEHEE